MYVIIPDYVLCVTEIDGWVACAGGFGAEALDCVVTEVEGLAGWRGVAEAEPPEVWVGDGFVLGSAVGGGVAAHIRDGELIDGGV